MSGRALGIAGDPLHGDDGAEIRVGFIGCGSHAFRNIYPTFQFSPVHLVATCDIDEERARRFAGTFGGDRWYTDHRKMLEKETLDAVFIVTDYDEEGRPKYPALAMDALRAGCHVWIEKPPAASTDEIRALTQVAEETGRFVMVGFKKCFFPAIQHLKSIIDDPSFGAPASITVRYPQRIPAEDEKSSLRNPHLRGFLDHLVHPGSILQYLIGPVASLVYQRSDSGSGVALLTFRNGVVGSIHFASGQSGVSPLERVEVTGGGANAVVENGVRLIYYRSGERGEGGYGREPDFIGDMDVAPIIWEPEFSLGQLYNKGLFMLGYAGEVTYFAECVLAHRAPEVCTLQDALEIMKLYEAFMHPSGEIIDLPQ